MERPVILAAAAALLGTSALADQHLVKASAEETDPPFSGQANVDYALALWDALAERHLVGPDAIVTYPYEGTQPHGRMLELLQDQLEFEGHTGLAIVKRNYAGEMEPEEFEAAIFSARMDHLDSVTVMYQREEGYDPDNANWFWAKYKADGSLDTNPKDMKLAGRVGKGAEQGCIPCHSAAPGGDLIYSYD